MLTDGMGEVGSGTGGAGACGAGADEKGLRLGSEHEHNNMRAPTTADSMTTLNLPKVFLLGQGNIISRSFFKLLIKIYEEVSDHPLFLCEEGYPLARPTCGGKF